jgi:thioredoxin-like negative regulator of GroEL
MAETVIEVQGEADLQRLEAAPLALLAFYSQGFRSHNAVIEAVAGAYGRFLAAGFVDIVAHPEIAARFAVRGLPLSLLLRRGRVVRRLRGVPVEEAYQRAIHRELAADPSWHLAALAASGELPLARASR